jgi:phosphoglycolate phosphatase-like HAD superfamily hydrolase
MTQLALERLGLWFSQVLTREDAPPKPNPAGLLAICDAWRLGIGEVIFVGDYLFDLRCGRAAGVATVLYAPPPESPPEYAHEADFVISHLSELSRIVRGEMTRMQ